LIYVQHIEWAVQVSYTLNQYHIQKILNAHPFPMCSLNYTLTLRENNARFYL